MCLSAWAVSSPPGSSPDDAFHLNSIWCAQDVPGPECDAVAGSAADGTVDRQVPFRVAKSPCYAQQPEASAACQERLRGGLTGGAANDGLYPSGFYRTMNLFAGSDVSKSVLTMRGFNLALASVLVVLALLVAPPGLRRASSLAWLCTLVPLGVFFIPSTNPTSWVVMGLGVYWVFLIRFLTGPQGWVTWASGALAVLAAVLAVTARTDGSAFLCVITVASVLVSITRLRDLLSWRYALPVLLVLGGVARFLTQQTSSVVVAGASTQDASPGRTGLTLLLHNVFNFPTYLVGLFGQTFGLGWIDTVLPPGVSAAMIATTFVVLMLAVGASWTYKRLAVLLLAATLVVVPLLILQQSHARVGETVQPRYLYPILIALIGFATYTSEARDRPGWRLGRTQAAFVVGAVSLANALALHAEIRRYVTGVDKRQLNLDARVEWWWSSTSVSPMGVWVIGSLAGLVLFALLGALAQRACAPGSAAEEVTGPTRPA